MKYCYSTDEVTFSGDFDSREEALYEGRALYPGVDIFTAECVPFVASLDAHWIIDQLNCEATDHAGEAGEEWLSFVPKSERQELEKELNKALNKWMKKTKNEPHFYGVGTVEKHSQFESLEQV